MAPLAEVAGGGELDLTNAHLATLAEVDLPQDLLVRPTGPAAILLPPPPLRRLPPAACRLLAAKRCRWPGSVQILDLTANRLRSTEPNLLALTGLRRLCLRQNLLSEGAEVEALASAPGAAAAKVVAPITLH